MHANHQQACSIFGLSRREFDQLVVLGFPAKKKSGSRGEDWSVDTVEAFRWLVVQELARHGLSGEAEQSPDVNAERARLLRSQANISELEEAKRRGELLPAGDVVEGWQAAIARARSLLLGMPPAAADQLVALARRHADDARAVAAVRERLAEMIHDSLAELANTAPDEVDEEAAAAVT